MTAGEDVFAQLRPDYLARLTARVYHLREIAQALVGGRLRPQDREELHRTAHSMASSAAIFGYAGLSVAARAAEQIFESPVVCLKDEHASLRRLLDEAECVLASDGGGQATHPDAAGRPV